MIAHWFTTAWRSLIANPLFSLITIASFSIGCCGAVLAGSNIVQHLSFERWAPDAQNIAKVTLFVKGGLANRARGGGEQTTGIYAANLMAASMYAPLDGGRFPAIKAHTRVYPGYMLLKDFTAENPPKVISVEPTFFDVFEFPVASGDVRAALKAPDQVIITQSFARRLFGRTDVVGETMPQVAISPRTNQPPPPLLVGAVLRDLPAATHFNFEAIIGPNRDGSRGLSRSSMGLPGSEDAIWRYATVGQHYIRFAPGFDFKSEASIFEDAFTKIVQTGDGAFPAGAGLSEVDHVTLVPLLDLHLAGSQNTGLPSSGDMLLLMALGGAALALLGVSTFNYVILSLARSLRRRKEVAVRKVLGASRSALLQHYLAEAALVAAISLVIGFAAAELLQPWFARAIAQPDGLVAIYDRWFLGIGGGALILLVLAVGFYPAFYLASVRPRSGLENVTGDSLGPVGRSVTSVLLALQVGAASVLLTLAITMAAQAQYVSTRPLGYTTENMYQVSQTCYLITQQPGGGYSRSSPGGPEQASCRIRRVADIRALPGVDAASSFDGAIADSDVIPMMDFGLAGSQGPGAKTAFLSVDTDFLQMVGAKLLAGRLLNSSSAYDRRMIEKFNGQPDPSITSVPIVVTRAMLPEIGAETPEQGIGKSIQIKNVPPGFPSFEVVGVVENWTQRSLRYKVSPVTFLPAGTLAPIVSIKPENLEAVKERIKSVRPLAGNGVPETELTPLSEVFEKAYAADRRLMFAVLGFAGIAMLVAGLGVYGLTAFDMQRRVREIGIRKALGATPGKVAGMVLGRQVMFTALASLASWPVGWWLSTTWLHQYAYRTDLGLFALPVASVIVIAFAALAVGLNTFRAAVIRPGLALRTAT
jgi:putative ABC transport system permease protein